MLNISLFCKGLLEKSSSTKVRQAFFNSFWQVGDKVFRLVVGLTVGVWVARYLQPDGFGLLNYAIALVSLVSAFSTYGLQGVMVREMVRRPESREKIVASGLVLRLMTSAATVVFLGFLAHSLKPNDSQAFWMVLIISLSLFPQAWDVIEYFYQSEVNTKPVVISRNISFVFFSLMRCVLVLMGADLFAFGWVVTLEVLFSSLSVWLISRTSGFSFSPLKARWSEIHYFLKTCWPLVVSGFAAMLYMRLDQVMLGQMMTEADVGFFSAAVRISEAWYFVPAAIVGSLSPMLTKLYGTDHEKYNKYLALAIRGMFWMGAVVALVINFSGAYVIDLLYGAHYAPAANVLIIHAWAGVFVGLGVASSVWYVNHGFLKLQMVQTLCGAVANFLLNLWLIPAHGIAGAAIATIVAQALSTIVVNACFSRTRGLFRFQLSLFIPFLGKGSLA